MSLLSRVGQFLVGSDDLSSDPDIDSPDNLTDIERAFLDESLGTMQMAALLEDRRTAAHNLVSFTKQHRISVGVLGLQVIARTLAKDREDDEMAQDCVSLLTIICAPKTLGLGPATSVAHAREFSEIFLKETGWVGTLFRILESIDDVYLRHDLLVLLCGLAESCPLRLQKILLSSDAPPNTIPLLVGLLSLSGNEILQTDSLLLLTRLAEGSEEVAKAIAFQSAMDSVLSLLGGLEGILAESALGLLLVLLKGNPSNQTLFFESGLLPKLSSPIHEEGSPHCLVLVLQCLCSLLDQWVSRIVPSVQDAILSNHVLSGLILKFCFDGSYGVMLGSEAFQAFALLLHKNSRGQDQILSMSYHGVPVVTMMIRSALDHIPNAPWAFHELVTSQTDDRLKVQVCATFVAPPVDDEEEKGGCTFASAGSLIIDALTGMAEDRKLAAMGLLSSLLLGSPIAKRMALEHGTFDSTSVSEDEPSIGLLHSLLFDMVGTPKDNLAMLASHLMLLSVWFHEFPPASQILLAEGPIFSFLLELLKQSYPHPEDQVVCQGLAAFLFSVCIGTAEGQSLGDLKAIIRTNIGHEVFRGKWLNFSRHLLSRPGHEHSAFTHLFEGHQTGLLESALLPPGASLNPALDQLKAEYQQSVNAYQARNLELEQALAHQQGIVEEWHLLRTRVAHLDSTLQSTQAELEMARLSLTASGGDTATALLAENDRLKKLADAYVSQMMAVEAENEVLLRTLSEYEARERHTGDSPKERTAAKMSTLVGLFQQPAAIVAKIAPNEPPPHHPSATFDV